ncbi:MAG: YggT family protein [Dehalococcoidales bacterium]|nr:YggT family protein [Dehalococcoidales bacterium]
MSLVFVILRIICEILTVCIFLRAIVSWIAPGQANFFTDILYHITEPILSPIRRILPATGGLDFAPLAAIIVLQVISFFLV